MIRVPKYKYYFAISDLMIVSVSFIISSYIMMRSTSLAQSKSGSILPGLLIFLAMCGVVIYAFERNNLYKIDVILTRAVHLPALLKSLLFASVITLLVFIYFYSVSLTAISTVLLTFVFSASLLFYLFRIEVYRKMILKRRNDFFRKNILIIGGGRSGRLMAENLIAENPYGVNIVGFLDDSLRKDTDVYSGRVVIGRTDQIRDILTKYYVDEALVAIDNIGFEDVLRIIDRFRGLNLCVKTTSERFDVIRKKFSRETYGGLPVIDITPPVNQGLIEKVKRVIDIIGSAAGLIILSPLFLALTVIIKLTSPGPVLFRQVRIGKGGKPFMFYKFRSMYMIPGEDEERKRMMLDFMKKNRSRSKDKKIINDKRVTWIGRFIRRTSLDELPQLFNVLNGDMSLVGPRPCLPYEYENYDEWQRRRVNVLPGCTGVWQVSGRSEVAFDDSVLLDLYYINRLSLFFDFRILLKTLPVMFFSKGGK